MAIVKQHYRKTKKGRKLIKRHRRKTNRKRRPLTKEEYYKKEMREDDILNKFFEAEDRKEEGMKTRYIQRRSEADPRMIRKVREAEKDLQESILREKMGIDKFLALEEKRKDQMLDNMTKNAFIRMKRRRRPIKRHTYMKPKKYTMEFIIGGYGDEIPDSAFNKKQLKKGMKVEYEHTKNPLVAKEIAKDHLVEHKDYYRELEKMEKFLENKGKRRSRSKEAKKKKDEAWEEYQDLIRSGGTKKDIDDWENYTGD